MRLYLAKTLEGITMYGPIYNLGSADPEKVEEYPMEYEEHDWMLDKLIDKINEACDALLDDGDVDYIPATKCVNLINMIDNLPQDYVPKQFEHIVSMLKTFALQAIEYDTGIAIEM